MNPSNNTPEQLRQFLQAIATQYSFMGDTRTVFLSRFNEENLTKDNTALAAYISWNGEPADQAQKLQDELKKICNALEQAGCPINRPNRGRQPQGNSPWEQAYKWLRETQFPQWQQSQNLNLEGEENQAVKIISIDALVQSCREKVKPYIQERCGTMRVLDMTQPLGLGDIYTRVNILEKITGLRRLDIPRLLQNCNPEDFDRFGLGQVTEERISGLEAVERHSKLMILGKPGAGKTTFLKHLALQCINRKFQENRIPFFITLKQFAENSNQLELSKFIVQQLGNEQSTEPQVIQLLKSGKFLLLLDGLDEVKEEDSSKVINHIKNFSEEYRTNQFIITCRIAAREEMFEKFTEVEVADFDNQQIKTFVTKWFQNKEPDAPERFIQQLQLNSRINELATNPLLLTLLCLEFEDSGDFPSNRTELYNRAIHTLLRKWDSKRGIVRIIVRDEVYEKLSVGHKEDLLTEVAWNTFEGSNYFFHQTNIKRDIQEYIRNLPESQTDPDALRVDSEAVLKSIEAHHGLLVERAKEIYSFSHITFHEYFTARKIVSSSNQKKYLEILASKIIEKRWHEVFLLTVGLLPSADTLLQLMKQQIDALLAGDTKLQQILTWVKQKSESVEAGYDLLQLASLCRRVNQNGRSMGIALTSCTVPANGTPTFELSDREIELGIGIHGEPGIERTAIKSVDEITEILTRSLIEDAAYSRTLREWNEDKGEWVDVELINLPFAKGDHLLAFVNSMGGTPVSELYIVYRKLAQICEQQGLQIVRNLIGPYITSLEMQGCSITLLKLDDEMIRLWDAPVKTPSWRWGIS